MVFKPFSGGHRGSETDNRTRILTVGDADTKRGCSLGGDILPQPACFIFSGLPLEFGFASASRTRGARAKSVDRSAPCAAVGACARIALRVACPAQENEGSRAAEVRGGKGRLLYARALGEADAFHGTSGDRVIDQLGGNFHAPHSDRRNWLHVGSKEAGPKIAAIFSVIESCRKLNIPTRKYLADALPGLAERSIQALAVLTPTAYAANRAK